MPTLNRILNMATVKNELNQQSAGNILNFVIKKNTFLLTSSCFLSKNYCQGFDFSLKFCSEALFFSGKTGPKVPLLSMAFDFILETMQSINFRTRYREHNNVVNTLF